MPIEARPQPTPAWLLFLSEEASVPFVFSSWSCPVVELYSERKKDNDDFVHFIIVSSLCFIVCLKTFQ